MPAAGRLAELVAPCLIAFIAVYGCARGVDVFSAIADGVGDGLRVVRRIFPALIAMLTAVGMLRASGLLELLTALLSPVLSFLGCPSETAPLMLTRPFSGSAALALGAELMEQYGADTEIGRTAAVMLGSTETTFYVLGVYFGKKTGKLKRAVIAALLADLVSYIAASAAVRLLF